MLIYHYHPSTGELVGSSEADKSPLEDSVYLIPACATDVAPPKAKAGFFRKFENGAWSYSPLPQLPEEDAASAVPTIDDYENAIQNHIDQTARGRQFRDGVTLASYVTSTNARWASEATTFVAWRDLVWAYAYSELAKVQAGERAQPSVDEVITELPQIQWPMAA